MSTLIERARKWGEERDQLWLERISGPDGIALVADAVVECETAEELLRRAKTP